MGANPTAKGVAAIQTSMKLTSRVSRTENEGALDQFGKIMRHIPDPVRVPYPPTPSSPTDIIDNVIDNTGVQGIGSGSSRDAPSPTLVYGHGEKGTETENFNEQ